MSRIGRPLRAARSVVALILFVLAFALVAPARANPPSLFVSSPNDDSVKRYDPQTGAFIAKIVASGSGGLSNTQGLAVGADGNLYVSSPAANSVKKYDGVTGAYLGNFVAPASGGLANPIGLLFGPDHNLYVASTDSTSSIKRLTASPARSWATS